MKKKFLTIIFVMLIFIFPTTVDAKRFYPEDTDLSIWIDEEKWQVFTRDNIYNNSQLDKLGITYDYMYNFMNDNNVYLDGLLFYEDETALELLITKISIDDIKNLSNRSNETIMALAKDIAEELNSEVYDVYESDFKYIYLKYMDNGIYYAEYITIVNGYGYHIGVQKPSQFTRNELMAIETIINSIEFDVDESLKEEYIEEDNENDSLNQILTTVFNTIFTVAILTFINKKTNLLKR